ncbi:uncharacterized protein VTP21DRAFT_7563 [Calcarisporiella thermophila]|uniref:uncharacterized protein n=1 Tax=Calcarisporiella thermophila TaxID=911321 RepID=UPI003742D69A
MEEGTSHNSRPDKPPASASSAEIKSPQSSDVSETLQRLRTRLSFAKYKAQRGWEQLNLEALEDRVFSHPPSQPPPMLRQAYSAPPVRRYHAYRALRHAPRSPLEPLRHRENRPRAKAVGGGMGNGRGGLSTGRSTESFRSPKLSELRSPRTPSPPGRASSTIEEDAAEIMLTLCSPIPLGRQPQVPGTAPPASRGGDEGLLGYRLSPHTLDAGWRSSRVRSATEPGLPEGRSRNLNMGMSPLQQRSGPLYGETLPSLMSPPPPPRRP